MKKRRGRPSNPITLKLIGLLDDGELYSPSLIAAQIEMDQHTRNVLRSSVAHTAKKHEFPSDGDGVIRIPGHGMAAAWFGWRWKKAYGVE